MKPDDKKAYDKLKISEIKESIDGGELIEADLLESKKKKQKDKKEFIIKTDQQKKIDDQERNLKKVERDKKRKAFWYPFKKFFINIFSVNTYIGFIQNFEELLLVIFIDALMLFILVSLGYIIYNMFISTNGDNISILIYKASAGIVVCAICLIAQANIPDVNKSTKMIEEEE